MVVSRGELLDQLERSRTLGFLGDGPVADQLDHAEALVSLVEPVGDGAVVDLGSGGGIPGLAWLLTDLPNTIVLLDRQARRTAFLRSVVAELGVSDRVSVLTMAAEDASRMPELRGVCAGVVARSFGPPPVTFECAGALVCVGGQLAIAEPPGESRWSESDIRPYGFTMVETTHSSIHAVVLRRVGEWPDHLPRPERLTRKRPLW